MTDQPEAPAMNSPSTPLSHRLRSETKEAHTAAERSGIMRDVLRGTVSRDGYLTLLFNLRALYNALETQLDRHRDHASLRGVDWNVLRRSAALDADLANFAGSAKPVLSLEPSTMAYVRHLEQLGASSPALLFPHAYLRYLGDLYGGQIMKRILEKAFPESANNAFTFYSFDNLGDADAFKTSFRQVIDELPAHADADIVVAEAQRGYELHAAMFAEMAGESAQL